MHIAFFSIENTLGLLHFLTYHTLLNEMLPEILNIKIYLPIIIYNHMKLCSDGGNICHKQHLAFARPRSLFIQMLSDWKSYWSNVPIIYNDLCTLIQSPNWSTSYKALQDMVFAGLCHLILCQPFSPPCSRTLAGTQLLNALHMPRFFAPQWLCTSCSLWGDLC